MKFKKQKKTKGQENVLSIQPMFTKGGGEHTTVKALKNDLEG